MLSRTQEELSRLLRDKAELRRKGPGAVYVCVCVYMYVYVCMYVYIYIYHGASRHGRSMMGIFKCPSGDHHV